MSVNPERIAQTDHPVLPVIAERYSPYAYTGQPVEREKLLSTLEAARWAASSFNEQPWRFIVAERSDDAAWAKALGCLLEANQAWAQHAGVIILTAFRTTFSRNDKPNRVALHDLGLAAGNLSLQAQSLGLHVHQMGGVDLDKVRAEYAVPEGYEPATAIAIGYAAAPDDFDGDADLAGRDRGERPRKPFGEWVFGASFDTPHDLAQ